MSAAIASGDPIVRGRALPRGFDETCDVVVVGSGAGGSVVAAHLAEAGLSVIVVEEGPHYTPEEYGAFRPTESLRRIWREAGLLAAFGLGQTPIIGLCAGRCVGGSSVLTGGVCFRIPGAIHDEWVGDLGLEDLSERGLEPAYLDVERRARITEVPADLRSLATRKFVAGAAALGITMKPLRRNMPECEGNGRCNFGCPKGAKMSVDVSYLPSAIAHGARVVSDALVERVTVAYGRATGIEGRILGGPKGAPSHPFRVRARAVVSACGTLHTPLLLMASGLSHPSLGRHVTLHPGLRVSAAFDEDLHGWDGALQSVHSDHFLADGITLVGVGSPPNVLAGALPGIGAAHRRYVSEMARHATFGGMVHDDGGGTVRRGPGREPILTYSMAERDLRRLKRAARILAEMALAGGAREVYLPFFGLAPIRSMDDARRVETIAIDARKIECVAFHPLGSVRMANDPRRGMISETGEAYELPGLWVADGSVLPTSIGVNSQLPIMSMATRIAWKMRDALGRPAAS